MRVLRYALVLSSLVTGLVSCQPSKNADGGGGRPAVDPKCGEILSQDACGKNTSCEWNGSQCSGSNTYCGTFSGDNSCPSNSCQWSTSALKCQKIAVKPATSTCSNYSQANCALVAGCAWNGTACATSGGAPSPTTGTPAPTTGTPSPTTGVPSPTTGGIPPANQCVQLPFWKCILVQGCSYLLLPTPRCDVQR